MFPPVRFPSQSEHLQSMPGAKRSEMYPEDQVRGSGPAPLDDALTGLRWLQNFSILSADPERPIPPLEVDYKTHPKVKPPYSHASLICMAMQASKQPRVTLSTIYKWITENFCYYTHTEPSWQNSIRHNLSFNKCFRKVPRQKDEPGKGGFWQIDPEYKERFVNGVYKRRARTLRRNKGCQGHQDTTSTSANEGVSPEQKPLLSKNNRRTMRSTKTPLVAPKPDSMRADILAAALEEVLGGDWSTLEHSDLNAALRSLDRETEGIQQPIGEPGRWQQPSYGYTDPCATTVDATGNVAELQMPQHYLYQLQDQQHVVHLNESSASGVGEVRPWAEVNAPPTLDRGFGLSEGFFTATCDHPPPPPLTVL